MAAMSRLRTLATMLALALPSASLGAPSWEQGKLLVEEKKCEACHHNKTMGDARAIYLRKDR